MGEELDRATAAILLGGEGRRLGGVAKHGLRFADGTTVLDRLVALLQAEVGPVGLVARPTTPGVETLPPLPLVLDRHADRGPAAGIHAALAHAPPGWVFVAACDLPCLDAPTVRALAAARTEAADVVLFHTETYLQPLAAFWHTRALPALEARLTAGPGSLHGLVGALRATVLAADDPRPFTNVNRPEELAAAGLRI